MALRARAIEFVKTRPALSILLLLLAAALLVCGILGYRYLSYHLWLERDSANLDDYGLFIVRDGKLVENSGMPPLEKLLDDQIVRNETRDRIVLDLSRSDIRYEWFGRKAYTKCLLRTGIPHNGGKTIRVKFLAIVERQGNGWRYVGRQNLTIE